MALFLRAINFLCMDIGMLCIAIESARGRNFYKYSDHDDMPTEQQLFNYIFRKYNPEIRPVVHPKESVNVNITFSLMQINSLDEKTQVFRTYGWLIVEWRDERLKWPAHEYENMTEFIVDSGHLWTPELALINAVEYQFPDFSKYRAILKHDGTVRWEPAGVFETSCKIDISFYPYDKQACDLVFGTWTYTSFQVNLSHSTSLVITDDYNTSGEWQIEGTKMETRLFEYQCCPNLKFSKVSATIFLKRKHRFYTMNLVLPCAMLSSLTLVTFLSPPDQGEKISLGISILLSFSVFMLALSENMPKTSDGLPLFGIFTTYVMLMNTSSVMLTVFVLNLHHRHDNKPVPRWVRAFVFGGLARVLCMSSPHPHQCGPPIRTVTQRMRRRGYRDNNQANHFTIAHASEQFTDQVAQNQSSHNVNSSNSYHAFHRPNYSPSSQKRIVNDCRTMYHSRSTGNTDCASTGHDDPYLQREVNEAFIETPIIEQNPIEDWKELARIMDRLFFWFTLLAMIFFCASVIIAAAYA